MITSTLTLTDFLLQRIVEDEAVAALLPEWEYIDSQGHRSQPLVRDPVSGETVEGGQPDADGDVWLPNHHDVWRRSFDRRRILTEAAARRRIVDLHEPLDDGHATQRCHECDPKMDIAPCLTLRLLALPYADHPQYDESWRP